MAAKKKSSPREQWDQAVKSGAIRPLKNAPAESFTAPGKSPSTQGVKTTNLPEFKHSQKAYNAINRTAGAIGGVLGAVSGASAGADAIMKPTKKNIANAALAAGTLAVGKIVKPAVKAVSKTNIFEARVAEKVAGAPSIRATRPVTGKAIIEQSKGRATVLSDVKRMSASVSPSRVRQGFALSETQAITKTGSKAANLIAGAGAGYRLSEEKNRKRGMNRR